MANFPLAPSNEMKYRTVHAVCNAELYTPMYNDCYTLNLIHQRIYLLEC